MMIEVLQTRTLVKEQVEAIKGPADKIIAVWDSAVFPLSVGGLLIFLQEALMLRRLVGASRAMLFIISKVDVENLSGTSRRAAVTIEDRYVNPLVDVALNSNAIDEFYFFSDSADIDECIGGMTGSTLMWPSSAAMHLYGSTLYVQALFERMGRLPDLSCSGNAKEWALRFIEEKCRSDSVITLHLKNKVGAINESNAKFVAWEQFLSEAPGRYGCDFIIVGNETIPDSMGKLPSVFLSKEYGGSLCRDLALIECSSAFMGMASGLCQMAMFSAKPYTVFKNPGHHVKEMELELGNCDHFNFSHPFQKLLRVDDTYDSLSSEFMEILKALNAKSSVVNELGNQNV